MKINENNAGLETEKLAATFLIGRGLKLVTQNIIAVLVKLI